MSVFYDYQVTFANEGVGGADSAYGAANIADILTTYEAVANKVFLILWGTNDADTVGGATEAAAYKDNMKIIIDAIIEAGATPCLAKVPFTLNPRYSSTKIIQYNLVIDQLMDEYERYLTVEPPDLYTWFNNNQSELYEMDGLHPTGVGYQSIAALWYAALTQ